MNIYLGIIILLLALFVIELKNRLNATIQNVVFFIGALSVFSLIAFRGTGIGGDTSEYVNFFTGRTSMYGSIDNSDMEIGFVWISKALHFVSSTKHWFLFSSTVITLFPFYNSSLIIQ